jgi:hypothetical protein
MDRSCLRQDSFDEAKRAARNAALMFAKGEDSASFDWY